MRRLIDLCEIGEIDLGLIELLTGNLSQKDFAKKATKVITGIAPSKVLFDEAQFALRIGDEPESHWMYLGNFYAEYLRTPRLKRDQAIQTMIADQISQKQAYEDNAPTKETLLPVLRDRAHSWISQMQVKKAMPSASIAMQGKPVGEDHMSLLVLDSPTAMRYVGEKELATLGLSFEAAYEEAIHNLRAISADKWLSLSNQAYVGQWGDTYDCSRLLLTDLIHRLDISGRPIAITPCRGMLLVASENNVEGQQIIMQLANSALEDNSRWTSPEVLVLDNDHWVPFELTDPFCQSVQQEMIVKMSKSVYDQQKVILDEAHKAEGKDIFVATFMAYKKSEGFMSVATWSKDVDAWLPKTEFIVFVDANATVPSAMIPWGLATQHVGSLMTPVPGVVPARFEVKGFPDGQVLQAMTASLEAHPSS